MLCFALIEYCKIFCRGGLFAVKVALSNFKTYLHPSRCFLVQILDTAFEEDALALHSSHRVIAESKKKGV